FGEARFRQLERDVVADACASPEPLVIACGGGAVLDEGNRRVLRRAGFVVWLRAPTDVLRARVGDAWARPLLRGGDGVATLDRLARQRGPAYTDAADAAVETAHRSVDDVAAEVVSAFGP